MVELDFSNLPRANRIKTNVEGAPFRIGDFVRVVSLSDETAEAQCLGRSGYVIHFEYSCGCGQTYPNDPMIGVDFGDLIEDFWKEELELLAPASVIRAT